LWACALVCLLAMQMFASTLLIHSFALTLVSDSLDFLFILSAFLIFSVDCLGSTKKDRLFWTLLSSYWGIRVLVQLLWMYFDLGLRKEVPNPFVGDILLFLSNIPAIAALLLQPHLEPRERRDAFSPVDFVLLLLWCLYLYLFFVTPWQYVSPNEAIYGMNYNRLDGLLDVAQLGLLGFLWIGSSGRWRIFYGAFAAAQFLKTYSTYLVNQAIDVHMFYPGSLLGWPFSVALACFTVVGLIGVKLTGLPVSAKKLRRPLRGEWFGIFVVLSLPVMAGYAVLDRHNPASVTQFRELVSLGMLVVMAALVFMKMHRLGSELKTTNQVLREASLTDCLTGLRNRRFFDTTISSDVDHVLRSYSEPRANPANDLIFYLIDLDDFKSINDTHGHEIGDKVLVEVSHRISQVVRGSDVVLRWGGDEFLVVSRYAARSEAAILATRILSCISDAPVAVDHMERHITPTCSVGWAAFPWFPNEPANVAIEAVLGLADRGLYQAKNSGRNRAVGLEPGSGLAEEFHRSADGRTSYCCKETACFAVADGRF
jgi:diguanylate cyclase (GGDEF)-like protein